MSDTALPDMNWGDDNALVRNPSSGTPSSDSSLTAGMSEFIDPVEYERWSAQQRVNETQWTVGKVPEGIDPEDYSDVLNGAYMAFTNDRRIPDIVDVQRYVKVVPAAKIAKILATDEFQKAAVARGIPWNNYSGLSSIQMLTIQVLTNPTDKRPLKAKLKAIGVTYPQYRAWMHQSGFSQYMNRITEGMLTDHLPDFHTVVVNKALGGDLNAIKYVNEMSGRHDPNRQVVTDLQQIVLTLLDIITRNITDPVVIQRIQKEFDATLNPGQETIRGEIEHGPNT